MDHVNSPSLDSIGAGAPELIELNIDMVRAGVAALSEWDREQEHETLTDIHRMTALLRLRLLLSTDFGNSKP